MLTNSIEAKRKNEEKLVSDMISLYCKRKHKTGNGLCLKCQELNAYARARSEACPFMETKTFCSSCKVHCYSPEMKEQIRAVMKYCGPRMLFHHPIPAIKHLISTVQNKASH